LLHVILYQPEIPPNTGNIMRLCANTGATLHLIEPMGFRMSDTRLRRAGLDYREQACVRRYADWNTFAEDLPVQRLFAFSTRCGKQYSEAEFRPGDGLLFGPETRGLPDALLEQSGPGRCLRLPMLPGSRSLNLSNSVAVALYEAWRQLNFTIPRKMPAPN
jgi:tRNA (cytidine/uridine-2'-O-)-methyltransferase